MSKIDIDHEIFGKALDPDQDEVAALLRDLQGNILAYHGRVHVILLFLQIHPAASPRTLERARQWIRGFSVEHVTSAAVQHAQTKAYNQAANEDRKEALFASLLLSSSGYQALALGDQLPEDARFRGGMKGSRQKLADPELDAWEAGYAGAVDVLVLLADNREDELVRAARAVTEQVKSFATVVAREEGHGLKNTDGEHIEHFGFVDGTSNPVFFKDDLDRESKERGGVSAWTPLNHVRLALVKSGGGHGSYLVFRKLEQNVRKFHQLEQALADKLGVDKEEAGALVVGRHRNGTPVFRLDEQQTEAAEAGLPRKFNNFTFEDDPEGKMCPFHAHIRKTNPRGDVVREFKKDDRKSQIVRRGVPYGPVAAKGQGPADAMPLDQRPEKDVGLLFMCFQANLADQFEFMQQAWANDADFAKDGAGVDPLIGQGPAGDQHWGPGGKVAFKFADVVTLKGGEYFFAPSLSFLRDLR